MINSCVTGTSAFQDQVSPLINNEDQFSAELQDRAQAEAVETAVPQAILRNSRQLEDTESTNTYTYWEGLKAAGKISLIILSIGAAIATVVLGAGIFATVALASASMPMALQVGLCLATAVGGAGSLLALSYISHKEELASSPQEPSPEESASRAEINAQDTAADADTSVESATVQPEVAVIETTEAAVVETAEQQAEDAVEQQSEDAISAEPQLTIAYDASALADENQA